MTEQDYQFWLCTRPYLGAKTIDKLLTSFKTAENVHKAVYSDYIRVKGIKSEIAMKLADYREKDEEGIFLEKKRLEDMGGHFVSRKDKEFPEKLLNIYNVPAGLFYYGELPDPEKPAIAMVGARAAGSYGMAAAEYFASALAEAGIEVISGLAEGIDGASHRGALNVGGKTWGVLGSGINICYPKENYNLFESMKEQGGILSEYPLGMKPAAWHFPMRNRIISGLSDGIFVIEARERSGSLITAELGLDQGKDIYALPGPFNSVMSQGCHKLIQSGAKLVFRPEDILEEIEWKGIQPSFGDRKLKLPLDKSEQLVYAILSLSPKNVDTIAEKSGISIVETLQILVKLELKGIVRQVGKNQYTLKI